MQKIKTILLWLTSDVAVACYAAAISVIVFGKGLPVIGGMGLGIAVTKLWTAIAKVIE